jgi:hypothetical protein
MVHVESVVAILDPSQWVWTDDLPAVALAALRAFVVLHRSGARQELLDVAAGGCRV